MKKIGRSEITIATPDAKNPLGNGAFAIVYKASWQQPQNHDGVVTISTVAIKQLLSEQDSDLQRFEYEVEVLSVCKHPNIINIFGFIDSLPCQMVLEYLPKGSVADALSKFGFDIGWGRRQQWAMQIAWALDYLHHMTSPIIHRDVKLDNVLISDDDRAKLGDFGFSGIASLFQGKTVGTPGYMAPEIVASGSYSIRSDNYAYALVVWELLCCQLMSVNQHERLISEELKQSILLETPKYVPLSIASSMINCLHSNPLQRSETALAVAAEFKIHERELLQADKRFSAVVLDSPTMVELKQLFQKYHLIECNKGFLSEYSNAIVLYSLLKTGNTLFFKALMAVADKTTEYSHFNHDELLTIRDQYAADYQSTCLRCFGVESKNLDACIGKMLQHFEPVTIASLCDFAKKSISDIEQKERLAIIYENMIVRLLKNSEPWLIQVLALNIDVFPLKIGDIKTAIDAKPELLKTSIPIFSGKNSALIQNFIAQLNRLLSETAYLDRWLLIKLEFIYQLQQFINALKINDSRRTLEFINELVQEHLLSGATYSASMSN